MTKAPGVEPGGLGSPALPSGHRKPRRVGHLMASSWAHVSAKATLCPRTPHNSESTSLSVGRGALQVYTLAHRHTRTHTYNTCTQTCTHRDSCMHTHARSTQTHTHARTHRDTRAQTHTLKPEKKKREYSDLPLAVSARRDIAMSQPPPDLTHMKRLLQNQACAFLFLHHSLTNTLGNSCLSQN